MLIIVGIVAWVAAGYAYIQTQNGSNALQGFSEAQDVQLSYRDGELIDRVSDSASLKAGSKTVQLKMTTLKYVVPLIKSAKISAVAKN